MHGWCYRHNDKQKKPERIQRGCVHLCGIQNQVNSPLILTVRRVGGWAAPGWGQEGCLGSWMLCLFIWVLVTQMCPLWDDPSDCTLTTCALLEAWDMLTVKSFYCVLDRAPDFTITAMNSTYKAICLGCPFTTWWCLAKKVKHSSCFMAAIIIKILQWQSFSSL